ncbi:unnamed protein product [Nesidiocoris tenuis]|uniref:Uncharacterized protein n=1 Tax=Nesidiocoris tenuis TaxID=355587 RepID=A0A6H5HBW1_9HEMI|nr:unnamed protein product [Nesidiocoris tenuis]
MILGLRCVPPGGRRIFPLPGETGRYFSQAEEGAGGRQPDGEMGYAEEADRPSPPPRGPTASSGITLGVDKGFKNCLPTADFLLRLVTSVGFAPRDQSATNSDSGQDLQRIVINSSTNLTCSAQTAKKSSNFNGSSTPNNSAKTSNMGDFRHKETRHWLRRKDSNHQHKVKDFHKREPMRLQLHEQNMKLPTFTQFPNRNLVAGEAHNILPSIENYIRECA